MQDSIDIIELVSILLKRIWIILLVTVLCAAGSFGIFKFMVAPTYTAQTLLYVNNNNQYAAGVNNVNLNDINASQKLVNTYIVILQNDRIIEQVAERCHLEYDDLKDVSKMITMKSVNNTEVFSIAVTSKSPSLSALMANTMAEMAPSEIIRVVKAGSVEVISQAEPPAKPSGPNTVRNSVIGGLLGLILASGCVLLFEMLDITVKGEEDLTSHYNIAVLGEIPDFFSVPKGGYKNYEK
ncbi:MAG TPA: Wzz/FepE/Etk N-terminal domain-containing protein [Clostridia bacterium]|nr:Wzz/FepE/Etk N-terminal domain-containing protein [Clostridia bacterium]